MCTKKIAEKIYESVDGCKPLIMSQFLPQKSIMIAHACQLLKCLGDFVTTKSKCNQSPQFGKENQLLNFSS